MEKVTLEQAVREGLIEGLEEFKEQTKHLQLNKELYKAYMIAQTKAFKKFYDIYERY